MHTLMISVLIAAYQGWPPLQLHCCTPFAILFLQPSVAASG